MSISNQELPYVPEYTKKHYAPGNIINGPKIKRIRLERHLSLEELAVRCDITSENLDRIEKNGGNTSTGKVRAIAIELGVNPATLITGVDELIADAVSTISPIKGITKQEADSLAFHPNRDVTLLRAFAGMGEAFLQIGDMKTPIPEQILADILHVIAVHKIRESNPV